MVTTHAAIPKTNPELVEARRRGIPVILRPVVLAKLMAGYTTLMVTGTHGKTTTTSMLIVALQHSGFDPSFAVGGDLGEAGTNAHHGSGDCFVAEADESDGSLLEYTPERRGGDQHRGRSPGLLRQRRGLRRGVRRLRRAPAHPVARWWCAPTTPAPRRSPNAPPRWGSGCCATEATTGADLAGTLLNWEQQGTGAVAHIQLAGEQHPRVMRLVGAGQAHGAQRARRAAGGDRGRRAGRRRCSTGWPGSRACAAASSWSAPRNGVRVFDDYAHHPTEVRATLAAVRTVAEQSGRGRSHGGVPAALVFADTAAFAREFGQALDCADEVFVLDVYAAREQPMAGVSGATVAEHVSEPVHYVPDFSAVAEQVADGGATR